MGGKYAACGQLTDIFAMDHFLTVHRIWFTCQNVNGGSHDRENFIPPPPADEAPADE